jgi:hypothetical protein
MSVVDIFESDFLHRIVQIFEPGIGNKAIISDVVEILHLLGLLTHQSISAQITISENTSFDLAVDVLTGTVDVAILQEVAVVGNRILKFRIFDLRAGHQLAVMQLCVLDLRAVNFAIFKFRIFKGGVEDVQIFDNQSIPALGILNLKSTDGGVVIKETRGHSSFYDEIKNLLSDVGPVGFNVFLVALEIDQDVKIRKIGEERIWIRKAFDHLCVLSHHLLEFFQILTSVSSFARQDVMEK